MTDLEKDQSRTDSLLSMSDFNPIASSTMIDNSPDESSHQPQTSDTKEPPAPEKYSEPPPPSVCFPDQPDSEQPSRPIGPMPNSDKIISETQDLINNLFNLMITQRRFLLVCAYQISSIQSIVKGHLEPILSKMETFLTHSNSFQTEWFFQYYRLLPLYVDYALVLKDSPYAVMVNEIPYPVKESTLKYLAEDAINNMFAGGLQVKIQRSLNMEVSQKMDMLKEEFLPDYVPLKLWMNLFEVQSENAKKIEENCFEQLSTTDLLNVDSHLQLK